MVADVLLATGLVFTVKVAVVAPAATVTLGGTAAAVLLLVSATTAPPVAAGPLSVTVPVDEVPPVTDVGGPSTRELTTGAVTIKSLVSVVVP